MTSEKDFQKKLRKRLKAELPPGCTVVRNNPINKQGIPDLTILCVFPSPDQTEKEYYWKYVENKRSRTSSKRPNQQRYVEENGYFLSPETLEEVLNDIHNEISKIAERARLPKPK